MISLSDAFLSATGRLGLGAVAAERRGAVPARAGEGRKLSPQAVAPEDPFFLAVAQALREAGYLDSWKPVG